MILSEPEEEVTIEGITLGEADITVREQDILMLLVTGLVAIKSVEEVMSIQTEVIMIRATEVIIIKTELIMIRAI